MSDMIYCWGCSKEIHNTAATCPHCGADQKHSKSGKPWGLGRMFFYSIFSILIPIAGLGAGIQGLLSSGKRKQGVLLLLLGVVGAGMYSSILMRPQYVQPDERFLNSELQVRLGFREIGLSVGQFSELLQKAVMDDGKNPQVKGWTKKENEYTLHMVMKQPVELTFTHMLQPPLNGQVSLLAPVQMDQGQVPALRFLMSVVAMVPEQRKHKPQALQSPVVTPAQQGAVGSTASGSEAKGRFGVVTVTDDHVRKLLIDGKPVTDKKGNPVESDHIELAKHFALPDMDVIVIYSNCGGTACRETGRYQFLILAGSGQRSLSAEFGDGRDNATIKNDGGKIVVDFGTKGMAVLEGGSIRISKELLP